MKKKKKERREVEGKKEKEGGITYRSDRQSWQRAKSCSHSIPLFSIAITGPQEYLII